MGAFAGFAHPTAPTSLGGRWESSGSLRPGAYLGCTPLRGRFTNLYLLILTCQLGGAIGAEVEARRAHS